MKNDKALRIDRREGVHDYDRHMESVEGTESELKVPRDLSHAGALGRSVSFAQLVATWAKSNPSARIYTSLPVDDKKEIERFASRLQGLATAYFADSVIGDDELTDLKPAILKAAATRIEAMSKRDYAKSAIGPLVELIFMTDTMYTTSEFHSAVYKSEPTIKQLMDDEAHGSLIVSRIEMNALLLKILEAQNISGEDFNRIRPLLYSDYGFPLGQMLHEAFRNTAEHAYQDEEGNPLKNGLRCILIGLWQLNPTDLDSHLLVSSQHPGVDEYFTELQERPMIGKRDLVHMFEVSVLDCGPGFISTIGDLAGSKANDTERVALCFKDRVSSKPGPNSGLGLGRILSNLSALGGFLRIRTSTTEVFYSPFLDSTGQAPMPNVVGDLPEAVGTVLTLGIPLKG
ncbi:MAG: hypothetical protein OXG25_10100 [Gammaproteobacteria bacterium]|nr:hypothetical protein [Gammaproteobacteria bacterium]